MFYMDLRMDPAEFFPVKLYQTVQHDRTYRFLYRLHENLEKIY